MAFGSISVDRITSSDYTLIDNYIADSGRPLSNRNLIINGAMQVAQRNTSVTGITTGNYYTVDRWNLTLSSAGTWTMNVESSGPANTEFRNSSNLICTTADSSLGVSDQLRLLQRIEGQNVQGIKKGTAAAESLTVSFYVKSSNTGTYICEFYDVENDRQISKSYTINVANTWEKKTITVPPDTTGQLANDNANRLLLNFWLAAGSNFSSGTLNSSAWASSTNANRAAGQLNLANLSGNYWAVTGIQLETGTVATPFEMRDIGQELALCQRYYYKIVTSAAASEVLVPSAFVDTSTRAIGSVNFPVTMRVAPTAVEQTGTAANYIVRYTGGNDVACSVVPTFNLASVWGARSLFDVASGLTGGQSVMIQTAATAGIYLAWSAEL
jgi:hypothetical protein